MEEKIMTMNDLAELINGVKSEINNVKSEIKKDIKKKIGELESRIDKRIDKLESKMDKRMSKLESETRARYYDMQNLAYSNNNLSTSAYVSTAASVGRSPRRLVNSYDTYR